MRDSANRRRIGKSSVELCHAIKNCQPLTHYTFSARVVFKPFVNREDEWEEYRGWVD